MYVVNAVGFKVGICTLIGSMVNSIAPGTKRNMIMMSMGAGLGTGHDLIYLILSKSEFSLFVLTQQQILNLCKSSGLIFRFIDLVERC